MSTVTPTDAERHNALPIRIDGPIIEAGYVCPCGRPEWVKHRQGCIWWIGPRDPAAQAYNPYVQAGYEILTHPLAQLRQIPEIQALEILDARVVHSDPWRMPIAPVEPADPFFTAGAPQAHMRERYEPMLLLRIRHPIAQRVSPGEHLVYEKVEEFEIRVREWLKLRSP